MVVEAQDEIIENNNLNRKDVSLFLLICLECYTIWQFGITYFADNSFSIIGNDSMPFAKNLDVVFLIGGLFSFIIVFFLYNYVNLISRIAVAISFISSFFRFFNKLESFFTISFYVESFCSMLLFGFVFAISIQCFSKKSILIQAVVSTVFSGIVIGLLNVNKPALPHYFFTAFSCVLQFFLFCGLCRLPKKTNTKVFTKQNINELSKEKKVFSYRMIIFLFILIFSETFIMQSALTVAETVDYGLSIMYFSSIIGTVLFIYLYFFKNIHIYSIFTIFSAICSIGFLLFLVSMHFSFLSFVACIIIGFSFIMFSLVVFFALILFSYYPIKSIFVVFPITISLTTSIHSLLLDLLKHNISLLVTVYCCFSIIMLIFWLKHEHLIISTSDKLNKKMLNTNITTKQQPKITTENRILLEKLSLREKEVVDLLLQGMSNPQIAEKLYISVNTVDTHRKEIYKKLNIHSRSELFKIAKE